MFLSVSGCGFCLAVIIETPIATITVGGWSFNDNQVAQVPVARLQRPGETRTRRPLIMKPKESLERRAKLTGVVGFIAVVSLRSDMAGIGYTIGERIIISHHVLRLSWCAPSENNEKY